MLPSADKKLAAAASFKSCVRTILEWTLCNDLHLLPHGTAAALALAGCQLKAASDCDKLHILTKVLLCILKEQKVLEQMKTSIKKGFHQC
jgi:hypothetical protein